MSAKIVTKTCQATTARRRSQLLLYCTGRNLWKCGPHRHAQPCCQTTIPQQISMPSSSFCRPYSSTIPKPSSELSPSSSSAASSFYDFDSDDVCGPVTERLEELVARGSVQPDSHQLMAARELDRVYHDLMEQAPPPLDLAWSPSSSSNNGGNSNSSFFFSGLFGRASANAVADAATASLGFQPSPGIPGIYMYGGVGCGKTFLMDLLYQAVGDTTAAASGGSSSSAWAHDRQMVHYHKFMLNVHQFMHTSRKEQREKGITDVNLIDPVVTHILEQGRFLCLDEFQVTDVADAMILKEVFAGLWSRGCVLVTTSNRRPQDLYLHGLQRDRFVPFIEMLERRCHVVSLMDNDTDYRMMMSQAEQLASDDSADYTDTTDTTSFTTTPSGNRIVPKKVYFTKGQKKDLQRLFVQMTKDRPCNPTTLETQGRKVKIPMACKSKSVAMFSFEDACQKALGAADYLVIGQQFSTVFLYGIPKLTVNELNWLRRFITFVDTMYELKVTLLLHTNTDDIASIFTVEGDKTSYSQDEVFAFDRTRSRLQEMASAKYLTSKWLGSAAGVSSHSPVTARLDMGT